MLEEKVRHAILDELKRQSEINPDRLEVRADEERPSVRGEIDIDALVMVVIGSIAGGP